MAQKILIYTIVQIIFTFIGLACAATTVAAQVIINEIHANPEASYDASEWIELHNLTSRSLDLGGWEVNGVKIPAFTLASDSYLVLTKNLVAFIEEFEEVDNVLEWNLSLPNNGKELQLFDAVGNLTDIIEYGNAESLVSWSRPGPECQAVAKSLPSPGHLNPNLDPNCYLPSPEADIKFSVDGQNWYHKLQLKSDQSQKVRLSFDTDIPYGSYSYQDFFGNNISNPHQFGTYNGFIKLLLSSHTEPDNTRVFYSDQLSILPEIYLSEVQLQKDQWLEIFNPNKLKLADKISIILNTTSLELKSASEDNSEYVVYKVINNTLPTCQQPSSCKYELTLMYDQQTVDSLTYIDWIPGLTIVKDLNQSIEYLGLPTAGESNQKYQQQNNLLLTEIYASPDKNSGEVEWLELFNAGDKPVDLALFKITDNKDEMQLSGVLQARQHLLIENPKISLNNSGEEISIKDILESEVDHVIFPKLTAGESYARVYITKYINEWGITDKLTPAEINKHPEQHTAVEDTSKEQSDVNGSDQVSSVDYQKLLQFPVRYTDQTSESSVQSGETDSVFIINFDPLLTVRYSGVAVLSLIIVSELVPHLKKLVIKFYWWWEGGLKREL